MLPKRAWKYPEYLQIIVTKTGKRLLTLDGLKQAAHADSFCYFSPLLLQQSEVFFLSLLENWFSNNHISYFLWQIISTWLRRRKIKRGCHRPSSNRHLPDQMWRKRGDGWGGVGISLFILIQLNVYLDQINIEENGIEMWSVALTEENIFFQFSDIISR